MKHIGFKHQRESEQNSDKYIYQWYLHFVVDIYTQ
jgi:hypothetical protein